MKIINYLKDSPVFALYESASMLTSSINTQLKKEEITFVQGLVLISILLDNKGSATPGDISKSLGVPKTNLSQILSMLEKKGVLNRKINEDDARKISLELTTMGVRKANKIVKILDYFERELGKPSVDFLRELQEIKALLKTKF